MENKKQEEQSGATITEDAVKSEAKKVSEIEAAKKILEAEKNERAASAKAAFEKLCKEYNVDFIQACQIGNAIVELKSFLNCPVFFHITAR